MLEMFDKYKTSNIYMVFTMFQAVYFIHKLI